MLGGWQSALAPQGQQAARLLDLTYWLTAVCTVVWLAVIAVLLWCVTRRRAPGDVRPETRERRLGWIVGLCVAGTVSIIGFFTVLSFLTTRRLGDEGSAPLVIQVRGFQWWWEVTYRDPAPSRSFQSANEIRIPVGRPVKLELVGADVIHSFWVPSLAGKMDMIPGRDNVLTFVAERPGIYRGQCAEFCGLQHAHMAFFVVAEVAEAFEEWRSRQIADAAEPTEDLAREGLGVFQAKPCAGCHTVRGTSATGRRGPDLTHVASRDSIAAGTLPTTAGSLAAWIADPQTIKPGSTMPAVPLSPRELRAVAAYLAGLK